jgi:hypothetical protein
MYEKARCDKQRAFLFPLSLREVRRGSRECPVDIPAAERAQVKFLRPGGNCWGEGRCVGAALWPRLLLNRLRRSLKSFDAAGRTAAGYFFLFGQEKVTKKKAAPELPKSPALLAPAGREPNSPNASVSDKTSERSEQGYFFAPDSDTGSRNLPAEAAMPGGGYGSRRQQQHRLPKSGI